MMPIGGGAMDSGDNYGYGGSGRFDERECYYDPSRQGVTVKIDEKKTEAGKNTEAGRVLKIG